MDKQDHIKTIMDAVSAISDKPLRLWSEVWCLLGNTVERGRLVAVDVQVSVNPDEEPDVDISCCVTPICRRVTVDEVFVARYLALRELADRTRETGDKG